MGIEFKTLEQFMPFWSQKILPAVYDDSLSYYQLLARILQKYNEIIEVVNKHSETLVDHENRITENTKNIELNRQQIEALKEKLAELEQQVQTNTTNIEALTVRVNNHDESIAILNNIINSITNYNTNCFATIDSTTHALRLSYCDYTSINTFRAIKFVDWHTAMKFGKNTFPIAAPTGGGTSLIGVITIVDATPGSDTTGKYNNFKTFGLIYESSHLHYFTAVYNQVNPDDEYTGIAVDAIGAGTAWREHEILDITNIKQSAGNSEYETISQKIITEMFNSKLPAGMGISGASAGDFVKITAVDTDGKPTEYGSGTPAGGVDVVQTTGQSTTSVMSQKAVTDNFDEINEYLSVVAGDFSKVSTAANATIKYPSTASGTDGAFLGYTGLQTKQYTRNELLNKFFGNTGANKIFSVQKTGATSFDRIAWFKSTAGEGLYDFAWYETDGTSAKTGIDRITMASNGNFAVVERNSFNLGSGGSDSEIIIGNFSFTGDECKNGGFHSDTTKISAFGSSALEIATNLANVANPTIIVQGGSAPYAQTVSLTRCRSNNFSAPTANQFIMGWEGMFIGADSSNNYYYCKIYVTIGFGSTIQLLAKSTSGIMVLNK